MGLTAIGRQGVLAIDTPFVHLATVHGPKAQPTLAATTSSPTLPASVVIAAEPGRGQSCRWRLVRPGPDLALAWLLLFAVVALWSPFAIREGFSYDDWSSIARLHFRLPLPNGRPTALALLRLSSAAGASAHFLISLLIFAGTVVSLFWALRRMSVPRTAAISAAGMFAVFPLADSLHLWWSAVDISLSVFLVLCGLALGASWSAQRARGVRSLAVLLGSEALLAAGVLSYEASACLVLLPVAALPLARRPRRTLVKALGDAGVALAGAGWIYGSTAASGRRPHRPAATYLHRVLSLTQDGYTTFFASLRGTLIPVTIVIAAGVAAVLVARARGAAAAAPATASTPPPDRSWRVRLAAALLLLLTTVAGWLPFLPATDWYTASTLGVGNRVNGFAQIFFLSGIALLISALGTCAETFAGSGRGGRRIAIAMTGILIPGALIAGFADRALHDGRTYVQATARRQQVLDLMQRLVPHPAPGTTIVIGDYDMYYGTDWVPVFVEYWDTDWAAQLTYDYHNVHAYPLVSPFQCLAGGLLLSAPDSSGEARPGPPVIPYAHLVVIDVDSQSTLAVAGASVCRSSLPTREARHRPQA